VYHAHVRQRGLIQHVQLPRLPLEFPRGLIFLLEIVLGILRAEIGVHLRIEFEGLLHVAPLEEVRGDGLDEAQAL
jgi:hypothetical protein